MCLTLLGCSINQRRSTAAYAFNVACSKSTSLDHAFDNSRSHMHHAILHCRLVESLVKSLSRSDAACSCISVMQSRKAYATTRFAVPSHTTLPRYWRLFFHARHLVHAMRVDKVWLCVCEVHSTATDSTCQVLCMSLLLQREVSKAVFLSGFEMQAAVKTTAIH